MFALSVCGRLAIALGADLFPDEALYAWIGRSTPFSFCPHPPGIPLMTRLGVALLGPNAAGIRLGNLLFGIAAVFPLWALAREIGGHRVAAWAAAAYLSAPMLGALGAVCTPDAPQLFFWTSTLCATHHALSTGRRRWWAVAGAVLGIGLYFKYILILYFPALAVALLPSARGRAAISLGGPWIAALVAAGLFGPVAAWRDWLEGWPTMRYHLSERQTYIAPTLHGLGVYHGMHLGLYSPVLFVLAMLGGGWALWRGLKGRLREAADMADIGGGAAGGGAGAGARIERTGDTPPGGFSPAGREGEPTRDDLLFLGAFAAVPWAFFSIIVMVTKRVLNREQWDAPAYAAAFIAAGLLLAHWRTRALAAGNVRRAGQVTRLAVAGPALGLAVSAFMITDGLTDFAMSRVGQRPLFISMIGTRPMVAEVDRHLATLAAEWPGGPPPFVLGHNFPEAVGYSAIGTVRDAPVFAMDHKMMNKFGLVALLASGGARMGQMPWRRAFGSNAVFVGLDDASLVNPEDPHDGYIQRRRAKLLHFFETVEDLPPVAIRTATGRVARWIHIKLCRGMRTPDRIKAAEDADQNDDGVPDTPAAETAGTTATATAPKP